MNHVLLLLLCAGLAVGTTQAEEVGPLPVRQACPDIDTELPNALIKAWQEVATPGVVLVQLGLRGREFVDVTPLQGPVRYFRHVRWAVRNNLHCDSGGKDVRGVRLNIRFVYPGEGEALSTAGLAIDDAPMP